MQEAIDAGALSDYLTEIFPRVDIYRRLQSYLAEYRKLAESGGWPRVPDGPTLRPGATDERLPTLSRRLVVTGVGKRLAQSRSRRLTALRKNVSWR